MVVRLFQEEELKAENVYQSLQVENKPLGLKKSSDFKKIQTEGTKCFVSHWMMVQWLKNDLGVIRYGCTASRKIGSAVVRNRLKRWTREYFRSAFKSGFNPSCDFTVIFRPRDNDFYSKISFKEFCGLLDSKLRKNF